MATGAARFLLRETGGARETHDASEQGDAAKRTSMSPGADPPPLAYLFAFRVRYQSDSVEESLERFLVTPDGWIAPAPRWRDLSSPRGFVIPAEEATARRARVVAAYEVARGEVERRAATRVASIQETANQRLAEELARLDAYYADLVLETLTPIRRLIHQLAAAQTYLELTRSSKTAAHFAVETAGLREKVEKFLDSRRTTAEALDDERRRRAEALAQRYAVSVSAELAGLAEIVLMGATIRPR